MMTWADAVWIKIELRKRASRGSSLEQTSQEHPMIGTP